MTIVLQVSYPDKISGSVTVGGEVGVRDNDSVNI